MFVEIVLKYFGQIKIAPKVLLAVALLAGRRSHALAVDARLCTAGVVAGYGGRSYH